MRDEPVLIDDQRVLALPIVESGEPLVDLAGYNIELAKDHPLVSGEATTRFRCRTSVADRLVRAAAALPSGCELAVAEAHRPLELQRHHGKRRVRQLRPRVVALLLRRPVLGVCRPGQSRDLRRPRGVTTEIVAGWVW